MGRDVHDKPSEVSAEQGEVILDGPDGVAVSMTPGAASETSKRLRSAAEEAAAQIASRDASLS
jgi:hypothetical protein